MEKQWICGACDMVFRSAGLLEKHAALLCIGGPVRGGGGGGGVDAKQTRTPELAQSTAGIPWFLILENPYLNMILSVNSHWRSNFQSVQKVSLPAYRPDPAGNYKMHHDKCKLIAPAGGPLSTQIGALRRAYTQSGGSYPAIVAQMIDLQAEAQSLEKNEAASAKATGKRENDERDDAEET
ncbi:hypothetical protein F2P81_005370 [Scophthalmus maximus]|uniref:Uncharacterized protein n=1 Tax=Scophthalmus maximus TaxID=52904 RepID=A0A6A4TBS0_SCOMX|nr:hypothetical protein F2P81_005370 [Scophthalmus maximus]